MEHKINDMTSTVTRGQIKRNLLQRLLRRIFAIKVDDAGVVDPGHDHVAVDHAAVRREAEASPTYTRLHAQHIQ